MYKYLIQEASQDSYIPHIRSLRVLPPVLLKTKSLLDKQKSTAVNARNALDPVVVFSPQVSIIPRLWRLSLSNLLACMP